MRRVNVRFLIGVLACVLLLAGGVYALHTFQYSKQIVALKKLVDNSRASNSLSERIEHLRRYTALVQDDAESLDELGTLLMEAGRHREASLTLATAINLYKTKSEVPADKIVELRRKLVEAAFATNRVADAEFHLKELIAPLEYDRSARDLSEAIASAAESVEESKRAAQSEYREQLSIIRASQGKWAEALELLNEAIVLDPSRCTSYGLSASILADQFDDLNGAAEQLDKMVVANPESDRAYLIRGTFRLQRLARRLRGQRTDQVAGATASNPPAADAPASDPAVAPRQTWNWTPEGLRNDALADARRALGLAPEDQDVLLLAMRCEFEFRDSAKEQPEKAAHMTEAARLAQEVIKAVDQEYAERLGKIEADLRARAEARQKRAEERGLLAPPDSTPETVSEEGRLALQKAVYRPAAFAYNVLAAVALFEDRSTDAMVALGEGLQKTPEDETLLLNLAALEISAGDSAKSKAIDDLTKTLRSLKDAAPLADYLDAQRELAKGELDRGLDQLLLVRPQLERWPDIAVTADLSIGRYQLVIGEPREAEKSFRQVHERRPDSVPAMLGLASALQRIGEPHALDEAQSIYADLNQRETGISSNDRMMVAYRSVQILRTRYADLPAEDVRWEQLLEYIGQLRKALDSTREGAMQMDLLEADVQFARGRRDEAVKLLAAGVERDPQSSQLWAALARVRTRPAGAAAGSAAGQSSESGAPAPDGGQTGASDLALETLQAAEAAIVNPTPEDRVNLQIARAWHFLATKQFEAQPDLAQMAGEALAADETIKQSLAAAPDATDLKAAQAAQLRLIEELGGMSRLIGDVATAKSLFQRLRESDKENFTARLMLFELALGRKFKQESPSSELLKEQDAQIRELNELLEEIRGPGQRDLLTRYGTAVVNMLKTERLPAETPDQRQQKVNEYESAHKQLQRLPEQGRIAQRMLFLDGAILENKSLLEHLQEQANDSKGWKDTFSQATDRYQQAFEAGYREPEFIVHLLQCLHLSNRDDAASRVLLTLDKQAPNQIATVQATAAIANTLGNPTDLMHLAQLYAQRVVESPSGDKEKDAAALLAYGQILSASGEWVEAEQVFDRVRQLSPENLQVWQTLTRGYQQIQMLRTLRQPDTANSDLKQKFDEILASAERALKKSDFGLLKANVSTLQGDVAETHRRFDAAVAEMPVDLRQLTADQIRLLAAAGKFYIQQPAASAPETVAKGEAILRRLDEDGAGFYRELREARLKLGTDADESEEERSLRQVVPDARRVLASRQMGRSGTKSLRAALEYVDRNDKAPFLATDADRRLKALIESRLPDHESHEDAIRLLKRVVDGALRPEPSDRLLLATMCMTEYQALTQEAELRKRANRADKDLEVLESRAAIHLQDAEDNVKVIVDAGPSPTAREQGASSVYTAALVQYIEILLLEKKGRPQDAFGYVDLLKSATQGTPAAATAALVEARVLFADGRRHDEVRQVLSALIAATPEQNRPSAMTTVAQMLEGFGAQLQAKVEAPPDVPEQDADSKGAPGRTPVDPAEPPRYFEAAESFFRQLAEIGVAGDDTAGNAVNHRLSLAGFYGRRGRTDDALQIINQEIGSATPQAIAAACGEVMKGGGRELAAMERLGTVLVAAREQHPDSMPMKLLQADLKAWVGDPSGAEALYREVLASAPTNVVAANNLAYVLATQKKQLDEALSLMDELIKRIGDAPDLLDTRAFVRLQRSEPQEALQDLGKVVENRPRPGFLMHQAQAELAAGQKDRAAETWQRATSAGLTEESVHPAERAAYRESRLQLSTSQRVTAR